MKYASAPGQVTAAVGLGKAGIVQRGVDDLNRGDAREVRRNMVAKVHASCAKCWRKMRYLANVGNLFGLQVVKAWARVLTARPTRLNEVSYRSRGQGSPHPLTSHAQKIIGQGARRESLTKHQAAQARYFPLSPRCSRLSTNSSFTASTLFFTSVKTSRNGSSHSQPA